MSKESSRGRCHDHKAHDATAQISSFQKILAEQLASSFEQMDINLDKKFKNVWQQMIEITAREGVTPWNMAAQLNKCPWQNQEHHAGGSAAQESSGFEDSLALLQSQLTGIDQKLDKVQKLLKEERRGPPIPEEAPDDLLTPSPHSSRVAKLDLSDRLSDIACGPQNMLKPNRSESLNSINDVALQVASNQERPEAHTGLKEVPDGDAEGEGDSCFSSLKPDSAKEEVMQNDPDLCQSKNSPASLAVLRDIWVDAAIGQSPGRHSIKRASSSNLHRRSSGSLVQPEVRKSFVERKCIVHPSSPRKGAWDVCSMCLIAWDTIWLPLSLSFEPAPTLFTNSMFWVTLIFWTGDIILSFSTGYYSDGEAVMKPVKIARNYISTWFLPDVLIVALDWMTVLADTDRSGTGLLRVVKAFRGIRVVRSFRLLRLAKAMKVLEEIQDRISADWLQIGLSVIKLSVLLLLCCHMIACIWWGLGKSHPEGEISWIEYHGFEDEDLGYKYLSSLHWTLTQFTPAGMEVYPHNSVERGFSVVVLLFALLFFSSFLSSITSAMTRLRQLNALTTQQFSLLRRFLKQCQVSPELSSRIKRFLEHRVKAQKSRIQEQDVQILVLLSTPLFQELREQRYKPIVCKHPFFDRYCSIEAYAMRQACNSAINMMALSEGDMLFNAGDKCEQMIFVVDGQLLYHWEDNQAEYFSSTPARERTSPQPQYLDEGDWCGEACLWVKNWVYVGHMRASAISNLLVIDPEKFVSVTLKYAKFMHKIARYAQSFVDDLNSTTQGKNDLSKPREEIEQVSLEAFSA